MRCGVGAVVGLAVGLAYLAIVPAVSGLVRAAWCGGAAVGCDPGGQIVGRLVDVVVWSVVLAGVAAVVCLPLSGVAALVVRVRVGLPLTLLGPPTVWALVVLGEPVGIALDRMRSPVVLAQTVLGYAAVALLTAPGPRPGAGWRWLVAVVLLLGTATVIACGFRFD